MMIDGVAREKQEAFVVRPPADRDLLSGRVQPGIVEELAEAGVAARHPYPATSRRPYRLFNDWRCRGGPAALTRERESRQTPVFNSEAGQHLTAGV